MHDHHARPGLPRRGRRGQGGSRARQRGNTILEFALVAVFLIPLLFGSFNLGMNLNQTVRVTQVVRDAGHMYARYVDFSLPSNKNILVRLAMGLGMTADGGEGVIILSKITFINDADCTGAGIPLGECVNRNNYVITHRVVVGNASLRTSNFGTPSSAIMDSAGNVTDIYRQMSARATNFSHLIALQSSQFAFVAEGFFRGVGINLSGGEGDSVFARAIY